METIRAIEAAIKKWILVAYGTIQSKGRLNCPLCALYHDKDCELCQVGAISYKCKGTPCMDIKSYTYLQDCLEMANVVEQKVIFLCSLLPGWREWYESFTEQCAV